MNVILLYHLFIPYSEDVNYKNVHKNANINFLGNFFFVNVTLFNFLSYL